MNNSFLESCIKFSTRYWISHAIVGCFSSLVFAGIARLCFRSLAKSISRLPLEFRKSVVDRYQGLIRVESTHVNSTEMGIVSIGGKSVSVAVCEAIVAVIYSVYRISS